MSETKVPVRVEPSSGCWDIAHERHKQVYKHGHDQVTDQKHDGGELIVFAEQLLLSIPRRQQAEMDPTFVVRMRDAVRKISGDPHGCLEMAGALIVAEIERRGLAYVKTMPNYGKDEHPEDYDGECACDTCLSYD